MEIGIRQTLTLLRRSEHGVYLGKVQEPEKAVLLPKKQVPEGAQPGDELEVFLYRDSSDRLIATTTMPRLALGELATLTVREVTRIGAFLDWGLEKDLFLPFKEQLGKLNPGDAVLVGMYLDKSSRLCATMKVQRFLSCDSPYQKDDKVRAVIYGINPQYGVFVAVDGKYLGMIPNQEWYQEGGIGDWIEARVLRVRPDGKLDLSARKKAYKQMDRDKKMLWEQLLAAGGELPLGDKSDPEQIREMVGLSKNAFKRAVGGLLKDGRVEITEYSLRRHS